MEKAAETEEEGSMMNQLWSSARHTHPTTTHHPISISHSFPSTSLNESTQTQSSSPIRSFSTTYPVDDGELSKSSAALLSLESPPSLSNAIDEELGMEMDIFQAPIPSTDSLYTPYGFIITCIFQILLGTIGLIPFLMFRFRNAGLKYFQLEEHFSDRSPVYLLTAGVFSVGAGATGLVSLITESHSLFYLVPHFNWIIATMCLSSAITARGNLEKPTVFSYYRLFEAVALSRKSEPTYLKSVWPDINRNFWDDLQKTMHCCGVEHATDWLDEMNELPESCCLEDDEKCGEAMRAWKHHPNTSSLKSLAELNNTFEEIRSHLYHDVRD